MDNFTLSFPIVKVDKARRVVTGIATADNRDPEGDIVDFEASLKAFENWVGNIREMHQPKSVGKTLDYRAVKVPYNGYLYDGIEVDAYISEGAEDTWKKVLDGTLRGFSVGGAVFEREAGVDKFTGVSGSRVSNYMLGELSLVDNPGNPAALISMVKIAKDGKLDYVLGQHDIYYCKEHHVADFDNIKCPSSNHDMTLIGTAEDKNADIIRKAVLDYLNISVVINCEMEDTSQMDQEDSSMMDEDEMMEELCDPKKGPMMEKLQNNEANDNVEDMNLTDAQKDSIVKRVSSWLFGEIKASETVGNVIPEIHIHTTNATTEVVTKSASSTEEIVEEVIEKSAEIVEDKSEETVVEETGGNEVELDLIKEALSGVLAEQLAAVKEEISAAVDEKIDAIQKSVDEVKATADSTASALTEVEDKVEKVADSGAVKKSEDDTGESVDEVIEKRADDSFWGGLFVPAEVANVLGYES